MLLCLKDKTAISFLIAKLYILYFHLKSTTDMPHDHLLVINTCPDESIAKILAHHLIERKLAACVNILPKVTSIYAWQGEINTDQEVILLIKTSAQRYAALEQVLESQHPYETPEIIAIPIERGLDTYLQWITQNT